MGQPVPRPPSTRNASAKPRYTDSLKRGLAATSIRDVASAPGVSPGLVQHHFATKDKLREAVDEYVLTLARPRSSRNLPSGESAEEIQRELGDRVTGLAREHPEALLYVARLAADEDPAALEMFDAFLEIAHTASGGGSPPRACSAPT